MDKWKFENLYKLPTFTLKVSRAHPNLNKNFRWALEFLGIIFVNIWCVFLIFYSIIVYDIKNKNLPKIFRNSTILVTAFLVFFKYTILFIYKNSFLKIINNMDKDFMKMLEWSTEEQQTIMTYIKKSKKVCMIWCVAAIIMTSVFPLQSTLEMIYYYWMDEFKLVSMFELTYPTLLEEHKNDIVIYIYLYAIHILYAGNSAFMFIGFDPLEPIFTLHACGLLQVAKLRVLDIYKGSEQQVNKKLRDILKLILYIYSFVDDINDTFEVYNEVNVKCSTVQIAFTAFQVIQTIQNGRFSVEYFSFLVGGIIHFYIPCVYSEHLKEASEDLRQAIYQCNWESHCNIKSRKTLLLTMTRLQRPPVIRGVFEHLSLGSFAHMCHHAYTILTFILATSRK